jgi:hypothetical protein
VSKTGRTVQYEYTRHAELARLFDRDPTVRDYISFAETFEYLDARGQRCTYTPAFKVWRTDGLVEHHDVVPKRLLSRPDIRGREVALQRLCAARGELYRMNIEEELVHPTEQANLNVLESYRARAYENRQLEERVTTRLAGGNRLPLGALAGELAEEFDIPYARAVGALGHMLWHGRLETELRRQLLFMFSRPASGTQVWLPQNEER